MDDWKDAIRLTIKDKQDAQSADETRRQAAAVAASRQNAENAKFLKETARPALDEIKAELLRHGGVFADYYRTQFAPEHAAQAGLSVRV